MKHPYYRIEASYPIGFSGNMFYLDTTIEDAVSLERCDSGAGFGFRDVGFVGYDPVEMLKAKKALEIIPDVTVSKVWVYRDDHSAAEEFEVTNEPLS